MGVNRYNADGYSDPTAYEAIKKMETFRITHPGGYLELNTENFFPCTVKKGLKVFRLVRTHCSKQQRKELLSILQRKAESYVDKALELHRRLDSPGLDKKEYNDVYLQLKKIKRQHERIMRNIEQLTGRRSSI